MSRKHGAALRRKQDKRGEKKPAQPRIESATREPRYKEHPETLEQRDVSALAPPLRPYYDRFAKEGFYE